MLEGQLPWFPNIAKFEEMFLLILRKRFKKQTDTCNNFAYITFKHSKEWWPGRVEEILHQIISFAFFSFINNIKSTNYNYVLIFKLQSEKKTLTVKHHEAYLTRMNFPIMWWKKGMITFPVGGSVFSYNIFAASKSCVILQNYPKRFYFLPHTLRDALLLVHIQLTWTMMHILLWNKQNVSKCSWIRHTHTQVLYRVNQQNEYSPFMTTRIASSQIFLSVTTLHVIFSPSAAVVL